ncbi:hypothetical protein H7X69_00535 [Candidatus Saccharibacteria bacterium]|nr:hypothetical protein [Candidatus Saccharibacteria bacterium]
MIKLPTETEIETLQSFQKPHCLSIYAPYITPTSANNPNRIQLKNLLKEARQLLSAEELSTREIAATLEPVEKLIDGEEFRVNHGYSLALFIHPDLFVYYRLPAEEMASSVRIDNGFNMQPIIELINTNPAYYVLLLSHNNVQLLKGDCYHIEPFQLPGLPNNMEQELNIDEQPKELQTHTVAAASRGKGSEGFHGQYEEAQVDKDMLTQFFRRIDRKLHSALKDSTMPLIIAGVDYLLPLYRQVSTYPHLLLDEIHGNLEHAALDVVHEQACQLVTRTPSHS